MGEYVKVICKKCGKELDEAWEETIDHFIQVEIDADSCECFEERLQSTFEAGYGEGYDEGRASKDD